jgi:hypothetical protein
MWFMNFETSRVFYPIEGFNIRFKGIAVYDGNVKTTMLYTYTVKNLTDKETKSPLDPELS